MLEALEIFGLSPKSQLHKKRQEDIMTVGIVFPAVVLFTTTIVFFIPTLGIHVALGHASYIIVILQNEVTLPSLASLNEWARGSEGSLLFRLSLIIYARTRDYPSLSLQLAFRTEPIFALFPTFLITFCCPSNSQI